MYRLSLLSLAALAVLVACSRPEPVEIATFRAERAPIYSSAVLEEARLSGQWTQVATLARDGAADCAPGRVDIEAGQVRWRLCLPAGEQAGDAAMLAGKPGRFAVSGMEDWWVLWADGDYRTLVIGTPSGRFGFVLNRDAALPPDRLQAVRDILRFNGYRVEDLAVF